MEVAEGGLSFGEERCIGLQAHVDEGGVDVKNGNGAALEFGTEEGVLVAVVGAGFVEANGEEEVAADEEGEEGKLVVGMK